MRTGMIQVGVIGVVGALLAIQFKNGRSEYGIYISVAVSLLIFGLLLSKLQVLVELVRQISDYIDLDASFIRTLMKMLGITYVAEFASAICKDAGYQAIAGQIEIFAKLFILGLSMPVLLSLLEVIKDFLI